MQEQFEFLKTVYFGNALYAYGETVIFFALAFIGLFILEKFILHQVEKFVRTTKNLIDDFVFRIFNRLLKPILVVIAFHLAMNHLVLSPAVDRAINAFVAIVIAYQLTRLVLAVLIKSLEIYWLKQSKNQTSMPTVAKTITTVLKVVIWGVAIVFLLDNLGFNVSAAVAGLGIGGVAVALAAQNILGDLFNYFVIFFDKPFEEGDFIIVDDFMGVIENVGIKTTRIRSLGGEQIVLSNTDLTTTRIRNYKRMEQRRIVFNLGVIYQTSLEKMKKIPTLIKDIVNSVDGARLDRAHFKGFGDYSLNIEVVYYVLNSDYNQYMDIQQKINLAIQEKFEEEKIEFAYPTQTLFMEKEAVR